MSIVQKLNKCMFIDRFREMGLENQFSYEALLKLYSYYDQYSEEIGTNYILDVIGICCEWCEQSEEDLIEQYDIEDEDSVINYMNDKTFALLLDNGNILYGNF